MKGMRFMVFAALCAACCAAELPPAQKQGAVPIRVESRHPVCINASTDRVWLTLRRVVTQKKSGWFTTDRGVGLVLSTTVMSEKAVESGAATEQQKPLTFRLMTEGTISDYSTGQVSVPLEYGLVSGLTLTEDKVTYTGLSVELTMLNSSRRNRWGVALQSLGEVADKLPIPASPYKAAATFLLDFANNAVKKDLDAQSDNDKLKSAALTLNFDPRGLCKEKAPDETDFEKTGTIAILQSHGQPGEGYVDIGKTDDYCWLATLKPVFALKAGKKIANSCSDASIHFTEVTNDYVAFFLNAEKAGKNLGAEDDEDVAAALDRCEENGWPRDTCLSLGKRTKQ